MAGERVKAGTSVLIEEDQVLVIEHILLINNAYLAISGHKLYEEIGRVADDHIRRYQFKSSPVTAVSPYSIKRLITTSSRKICGVKQYTAEIIPSSYCY